MADPTRKTGTPSIPEEGAPEEEVEPELSVGKKMWYVDRELDALKLSLKEGNRVFAAIRTRQELQDREHSAFQREFDNKIESVRRELEGKDFTIRRELEALIASNRREIDTKHSTEVSKVEANIAAVEDRVSPRTAWWKIAGGIAGFFVPIVIAIIGWVWMASKYPNREEFRELQDKVQDLRETIIKINTIRDPSLPLPKP